jgi:hypothetical protein
VLRTRMFRITVSDPGLPPETYEFWFDNLEDARLEAAGRYRRKYNLSVFDRHRKIVFENPDA